MKTLQKQQLFWDVDLKEIDPVKHRDFIIERILERGDEDDFKWVLDFYGTEAIKKVFLEKIENLDPRSQNFWCLYFNLNPSECIPKPSMKKQSAFSQR